MGKTLELMTWSVVIVPAIVAVLLWCYISTKNPAFLIGIPIVIVIGVLIEVTKNKKLKERTDAVNTHVEELARERKARIEEAKLFYTSAEWRLVRAKVIKQQGKVCYECRQTIKNVFDITVDHIKPRSVYPEEALKLGNLRVLCRSCNAKKGDNIINESDFLIDT